MTNTNLIARNSEEKKTFERSMCVFCNQNQNQNKKKAEHRKNTRRMMVPGVKNWWCRKGGEKEEEKQRKQNVVKLKNVVNVEDSAEVLSKSNTKQHTIRKFKLNHENKNFAFYPCGSLSERT